LTLPTEAETRRRKKQDATRKRAALWLEPDDRKALERVMRKHRLPSRVATLRWLIEQTREPHT
jgi:hypothetical protein